MNKVGISDKSAGEASSSMSWAASSSSASRTLDSELSEKEMEAVTTVFRSFETGVREASIDTKDLVAALKMLGLNPMEQEIIDVTNEIAKNGLIYFPEFCKVVKTRYRSDDEEVFRQNFFKVGIINCFSCIIVNI